MGLSTVFGLVATFFALFGSMLGCTMLLARYNGGVDKEFPILLSEYFEVNVKRNDAIVKPNRGPQISSTAQLFKSTWDALLPLNSALSLPKATLQQLAQNTSTQTGATADSILKNKVDLGPIEKGYDIYNDGLQEFLKKSPGFEAFVYNPNDFNSRQQYAALEATLETFDAYATSPKLDAAEKAELPLEAASVFVNAQYEKNDERFETLRIQTRVAVASSVVSIISFTIALTVLFVEKKTYKLVFLNCAGAIGGLIFLIMIQLNKDTNDELLEAGGQPIPDSSAGPAVFAAGFAMAAGVLGTITSALYVRVEGGSNDSDEEEISMDEIKSEEAVKADL